MIFVGIKKCQAETPAKSFVLVSRSQKKNLQKIRNVHF